MRYQLTYPWQRCDLAIRLSWQAFEKNHTPLSATNRSKIASARASLKTRITKHNKLAGEVMGTLERDPQQPEGDALFMAGVRLGDLMRNGEWETDSQKKARERSTRQPEYYGIDLPSSRSLGTRLLDTDVLARAGAYEIVLRVAWMAHLLHEICLSLVVQVEIFRRTIKRTPGSRPMTQREKTQTMLNMREQYQSVRVYAQQYNVFHVRTSAIRVVPQFHDRHPEFAVAATAARKADYQILKPKDIRCDTNVYDSQGTGRFTLPWFWKLTARRKDIDDETFVQDCACPWSRHWDLTDLPQSSECVGSMPVRQWIALTRRLVFCVLRWP